MGKYLIDIPQWQYEKIKSMVTDAKPADVGVMINVMTAVCDGMALTDYHMTNLDVLLSLFPEVELIFKDGTHETSVDFHTPTHRYHAFDNEWAKMPYKEKQNDV